MALAALRIDEASIERVPKKFWTDRDFVLAAVRFQPSALNMVEPDWLNERKCLSVSQYALSQAAYD